MMHGAPALVFAQHLGRNLRFNGSPLFDRPRSNILRHQRRSRQITSERRLGGAERPPPQSLRFSNPGSAFHGPGTGRQPAVESAAPLSRHNPHDARRSGSGLCAAPRSKFALQWQPSVRQAALKHLATPTPFSTDYFRACTSGSRAADNSVHQLSLMISPCALPKIV
jgi:hypothetical protein